MSIEKYTHHNEGDAWIITSPDSLSDLETKAMDILTTKQVEFFKNYPNSLDELIDKAGFESFRNWLKQLKKNEKITLEIYGKGYIQEEVWFSFNPYDDMNIWISCESKKTDVKNEKLQNIAETVGRISTMGYSAAGGLDPFEWKHRLYSTPSGEELAYDKDKKITYWNFEPMQMENIPYTPLDDFLDEFFIKLCNNERIYPEESWE